MLKRMCALGFAAAVLCCAQAAENSKPQSKFYKVVITVKDLNGENAVVASHEYTTTLQVGSHDMVQIEAGDRVPFTSGDKVEYQNVGTHFGFLAPTEVNGELAVTVNADVSTAASTRPGELPLVRHVECRGPVLAPIGKKTKVFSVDNATSNGHTEIYMLVTPME